MTQVDEAIERLRKNLPCFSDERHWVHVNGLDIRIVLAEVERLQKERTALTVQLKEARKVFAPVFKNFGPEWPDSEGLEVVSSHPDDEHGEEGVGKCDLTLGQLRRALKDPAG